MTNILRHAGICRVKLQVSFGEDIMTCKLVDTGVGFAPDTIASKTHFGLEGLENRVTLVRGTFKVESSPGNGCTLTAELPRDPVSLIGYEHG